MRVLIATATAGAGHLAAAAALEEAWKMTTVLDSCFRSLFWIRRAKDLAISRVTIAVTSSEFTIARQ